MVSLVSVTPSGCGSEGLSGWRAATLDADDSGVNTALRVTIDDGADLWETNDHRPATWTGARQPGLT